MTAAVMLSVACHNDVRNAAPGNDARPAAVTRRAGTADSLAAASASPILQRIERDLAPISAARDSLIQLISHESDALHRDSLALDARDVLLKRVSAVESWFDRDSAFQVVAGWPQRDYRAYQLQHSARLSPEDSIHVARFADSVKTALLQNGTRIVFGEGDGYLQLDEPSFLEKVRPYISSATQEFLQLQVDEQLDPSADDAALMPWDSFATRLAHADELLRSNPHAAFSGRLGAMRNRYLALFLTGVDNTPGFTRITHVILPEHQKRLTVYVREHPGTPASEQIITYLDLLKASHGVMSPGVKAFVDSIRD